MRSARSGVLVRANGCVVRAAPGDRKMKAFRVAVVVVMFVTLLVLVASPFIVGSRAAAENIDIIIPEPAAFDTSLDIRPPEWPVGHPLRLIP